MRVVYRILYLLMYLLYFRMMVVRLYILYLLMYLLYLRMRVVYRAVASGGHGAAAPPPRGTLAPHKLLPRY